MTLRSKRQTLLTEGYNQDGLEKIALTKAGDEAIQDLVKQKLFAVMMNNGQRRRAVSPEEARGTLSSRKEPRKPSVELLPLFVFGMGAMRETITPPAVTQTNTVVATNESAADNGGPQYATLEIPINTKLKANAAA